jgi:hypothetical protein
MFKQMHAHAQRSANGAPFVYHGVRLFETPDGRVEEALAAYIFGVLGASNPSPRSLALCACTSGFLLSYIYRTSRHNMTDALQVAHGPSHAEVMWLDGEDAPCLVEIGCRCVRESSFLCLCPLHPSAAFLTHAHNNTRDSPHGGDGVHTELARRCIGYSQLDAMLGLLPVPPKGPKATGGAAIAFPALPPRQPRPLRAHAEVVMLVAQ